MTTWQQRHQEQIRANAHPVVTFVADTATYVIFGGAAIGAIGMITLVVLAALGVGR